jgi:ligand-binding SRPBCC domain-containing protein
LAAFEQPGVAEIEAEAAEAGAVIAVSGYVVQTGPRGEFAMPRVPEGQWPAALISRVGRTLRGIAMRFVKESIIRAPVERVFAFHQLPDALRRLTPPWEKTQVIAPSRSLNVGERTVVRLRIFGVVPFLSVSEHTKFDPPHMFEDKMLKGPFRRWVHRHSMIQTQSGTLLRDDVDYDPPLWPFGRLFAPMLVEPRLGRLFDYRHEVTRAWCERPSDAA